MPGDLSSLLRDTAIDGTVLIQAAPTLAETEFLLDLAQKYDFIRGVVGWADFEAPDAPDVIARLAQNPLLVGLRPMIQDIADTGWMLRQGFGVVFQAMIDLGLTFDALTLPHHLTYLRQLLARHPDLCVIIEHGAKPLIRAATMDGWVGDMAVLARDTNAYCKLSGLVTEAGPNWAATDLKPYVDHLLKCFGPGRLIWGSDWPVCTLSASYDRWHTASLGLLSGCTTTEQDAIFGGNAQRAYRLKTWRRRAEQVAQMAT